MVVEMGVPVVTCLLKVTERLHYRYTKNWNATEKNSEVDRNEHSKANTELKSSFHTHAFLSVIQHCSQRTIRNHHDNNSYLENMCSPYFVSRMRMVVQYSYRWLVVSYCFALCSCELRGWELRTEKRGT